MPRIDMVPDMTVAGRNKASPRESSISCISSLVLSGKSTKSSWSTDLAPRPELSQAGPQPLFCQQMSWGGLEPLNFQNPLCLKCGSSKGSPGQSSPWRYGADAHCGAHQWPTFLCCSVLFCIVVEAYKAC